MAYVSVPKDLSTLKTKVIFGLTQRQVTCFSMGIAVGLSLYYACIGYIDSSDAMTLMMMAMFPFFMLAMYEKNGETLEIVLRNKYNVMFGRPKLRPYKSVTIYNKLESQYDLEREVKAIVGNTGTNSRVARIEETTQSRRTKADGIKK